MNNLSPENDAVIQWLGKRMGISHDQSATFSQGLLSKLASDPKAGLRELFEQLGRKVPPESKLRQKERELSQAMETVREETSSRVRQIAPVSGQRSDSEKEEHLGRLIEQLETSFGNFEQRIRGNAESMILPAYLKIEDFYGPFISMQMNRENPQRNMLERYRKISTGQESSTIALQNPYHFFYGLKEGRQQGEGANADGAAAFSPHQRVMTISPDHDPAAVIDNLILYHELRHANQDAVTRISLMQNPQALQAYFDFHTGTRGQRPKLIVTEEATAYGYEMEAFNILLKGKLQTGRMPSVNEVMRDLGCAPKERYGIELLLSIAEKYFPEGMQGGGFSGRFIEFMRDTHIDLGYDVFSHTTTGRVRQMQKNEQI